MFNNKLISDIEEREGIKVLFLIESGSRAWGWESDDSDFDFRGVFVQNYNKFKELKSQVSVQKDCIDMVLWDLKKFLRLMSNSNPSVWEWLSSNIVYIDSHFREELKSLFINNFSKFSLMQHYVSMARNNFEKYINNGGYTANLKKYLYVLRSIACVNYIEETGLPPPKHYKYIISFLPDNIRLFFERIIIAKRKSESLEGPRDLEVESYIQSHFNKSFEVNEPSFSNISSIFDSIMLEFSRALDNWGSL